MIFKSVNEAILAYENAAVTLHSRIKVRVTKTMPDGTEKTGVVESTLGRFIFNEIIPQDLASLTEAFRATSWYLRLISMWERNS